MFVFTMHSIVIIKYIRTYDYIVIKDIFGQNKFNKK